MNSKNSDYHILVVMQSICSPHILTKTPELQTTKLQRENNTTLLHKMFV